MDDLRTVMDDSGIDRAVLVANLASSFMAMVFAATYPARVRALVMVNPYPRFTRADDYPWGFDAGNFDMVMERTRRLLGKGMLLRQFAPSLLADAALVEQELRYERQAASPGTAMAMTRMINLIDVRSVLPTITVPTMVISRADPSANRWLTYGNRAGRPGAAAGQRLVRVGARSPGQKRSGVFRGLVSRV